MGLLVTGLGAQLSARGLLVGLTVQATSVPLDAILHILAVRDVADILALKIVQV